MINYSTKDIFETDVEAIVNTVNTVGVMGKGLALQFKRRYPSNFAAYKAACDAHEVTLGKMFVTESAEIGGPRWIINFPTKGHWKANSRLEDIQTGLKDLLKVIRELGISSIAVPPLGAGNGGLNWVEVRPVIQSALFALEDVRVEIIEPSNGHRELARPQKALTMTPTRALMIQLMLAYGKLRHTAEPWEDARAASHLEIQKLMYFADLAQPGLRLNFEQGHYGPFSDIVRLMLSEMEGEFVKGFGDGSDPVLQLVPIQVTDLAIERLEAVGADKVDKSLVESTVASVISEVDGFEGPYPLELLASVSWAQRRTRSDDVDAVTAFIRGWNERKGRIFTPAHVGVALNRVLEVAPA